MTDKELKKIKKDYMAGIKYKDIQEKNNITNSQLIYLIQKNKWKRENNRSQAMKNNKNAKGNKGGPGAEKGNKRALSTGEYENIFSGAFSEDEKILFDNYKIENKKDALLKELKTFEVREFRMLNRIKEIKDKNRDLIVTRMKKDSEDTSTEAENTLFLINKIEEGLTRVQEAKRRCIESLEKIGIDKEKLKIEKEKLKIEQKRLELELQNQDGEEVEDTSETDVDLYGN